MEDEKIRSYVTNDKNREYFINLVNYLKDQVILSDAVLSQSTIQAHARLDDISEDTVDLLYYIQDILLIGAEEINTILCSVLLLYIILYIYCIVIIIRFGLAFSIYQFNFP